MASNIEKIIGGPALVKFRGASFYSQGDIVLQTQLDTFDINVDRFAKVDERVADQPIRVSFTPAGEWENLNVLWPYADTLLGDYITPVRTIGAVDAAGDFVTLLGQALPVGAAVQFTVSDGGTIPAGLAVGVLYYLGSSTPGQYKFYDTYAHAIAGGPTGLVDITTAGAGVFKVVVNEPLVIHSFDGTKVTIHNAAVVVMPSIIASTIKTLLGEVVFEGFLAHGKSWGDANSFYTITQEALVDTTFDPADIITQAYVLDWGAAPWANMPTKDGVTVAFDLGLEAVSTDTDGVLTRRLGSLAVNATATPIGLTEAQLLDAIKFQGAGSRRGRSLAGADLTLTGTGVYIKLTAAALKGGPAHFSSKLDRVGELTWAATRTFTAGTPNPLFVVGTAP